MAQSSVCCTFSQNLLFGAKDELAGATPTSGNKTLVVLFAPTPAASVAPPIVFALSSVVQYLENDFQRIFRIILDSKPFAPPWAPALALQ